MTSSRIRLKKGDTVTVLAGKDKGKSGKILKINKVNNRIIVEGLNMVKKTMRPKKEGEKGGIIEVEAGLHVSNLAVICKKCGPTRIGYKIVKDQKSRICKKCGDVL